MTNPEVAGVLAKEAMERVLERKKEIGQHQKSRQGVIERAARSIALHKIGRNAQLIVDLCEKDKMGNDDINMNVMLQKLSSLISNMKNDIDKINKC